MLEAVPKNIFANNFYFQQENKVLGEMDSSIWREKARLELEKRTYLLYRERTFGGEKEVGNIYPLNLRGFAGRNST